MADQRIQYTEYMVGANHPSLPDTLNRLTLVEHNTDGTHNLPLLASNDRSTRGASTNWVGAYFATLASPTLTGIPTAPTATPGTSTTQIATTAFVETTYAHYNSPALTGTPTAPTPTTGSDDVSIATTAFAMHMQSPAFVGTPTAPTAAPGTNNTQIATTAFATQLAFQAALPVQPGGSTVYTLISTGGIASWGSPLPDYLIMAQGVI